MDHEQQKNNLFFEDENNYNHQDGSLPLKSARQIVADIFLMHDGERDRADMELMSQELTEFIRQLLAQSEIAGTADDWHNLVVDIARKDYYDLCCDLLEEGLRRFPGNADLLGDYLQYGTSCNRIEQCKQYYKQLSKLPRVKYSWRSFHFSVSWLTYLWDASESQKEMDKLYEQMLVLTDLYRKYFPYDEDSYVCTAEVYSLQKERERELEVLTTAVEAPFPSPKCALRLADICFDRAQYSDALAMVNRSLRDANQVQSSVNEEYLYYLAGLARISMLNESMVLSRDPSEEAMKIYRNFEDSLLLDSRRFRDRICKKSALLKRQTGIDIPDDCRKLYELLDGADLL